MRALEPPGSDPDGRAFVLDESEDLPVAGPKRRLRLRSPGLQGKLDALEIEHAALKAQLSAPPQSPVRLHPNLADAYREKVAALHDALYLEDTKAEAFEILHSLGDKVVIHDRPGQKPEIELIGDIAAMVEISMQGPETPKAARRRAAFDEHTVRSVKVVAGTCSQCRYGTKNGR